MGTEPARRRVGGAHELGISQLVPQGRTTREQGRRPSAEGAAAFARGRPGTGTPARTAEADLALRTPSWHQLGGVTASIHQRKSAPFPERPARAPGAPCSAPWRLLAASLLAMLFLSLLPACGSRRPTNVLLLTVDTLRQDRLSCYGYEKNETPHVDALAARGVLFLRAFCDVTWTTPSMASVFTAKYATRHGLRHSRQRLGEMRTLAEILRERGFATAAVIGSFPVDSTFGLDRGFDFYDEDFDTSVVKDDDPAKWAGKLPEDANEFVRHHWFMLHRMARAYRPDDEVADRAIGWLRRERREPFFLWVHFFGPHEKMYVHLPLEELIRKIVNQYDPDVSFVDRQVGRVLQALRDEGLEEKTLVVFHADHGQNLFERWYVGHGRDLYDPSLRIPLIIAGPGVARGVRSNAFARNIDILPTVLGLLGIEVPSDIDGKNLAVALRHPWLARLLQMKKGETYAETYLSATGIFAEKARVRGREVLFGYVHRGIRTERWKYVEREPVPLLDRAETEPLPEALVEAKRARLLYDVRNDPFETTDVSAKYPQVVRELTRTLLGYRRELSKAPTAELGEGARERLRTLGYLERP